MKAKSAKSPLLIIPGIGPAMVKDLHQLGVFEVTDLKGRDPEQMYQQICDISGTRLDPCVLYTYRCAVYFAKTKNPDPELLKWWNWKNRRLS